MLLSSDKKVTPESCFFVSAKNGSGIEALKKNIEVMLSHNHDFDGKEIVTQARHYNHLTKIQTQLINSRELLLAEESPDLISQELSMGMIEVNPLMGKEYNDEILDKIFSEFCLGK